MGNKYIAAIGVMLSTIPMAMAQAQSNDSPNSAWVDHDYECTMDRAIDVRAFGLKDKDSGEKKIPKIEGKGKILCLKREEEERVFTKVLENRQNSNGSCTSSFSVEGSPWNEHHPKWNEEYNLTGDAIKEATTCQVIGYVPNRLATKKTYKLYTKEYNYDASAPICGKITYHKYIDGQKHYDNLPVPDYTGGWYNERLAVKVQCEDGDGSGCITKNQFDGKSFVALLSSALNTVFSDFIPLAHNSDNVKVTFWDAVENSKTSEICNLEKPFKLDQRPPQVEIGEDPSDFIKKLYPLSERGTVHTLADKKDINLRLIDETYKTETTGVSGIKDVSISARIYGGNDVCNISKDFPENSNDTQPVQHDIDGECDFTKAGTYQMFINVEDHAGNKLEYGKEIIVHPNNNVSLIAEKTSSQEDVYANHKNAYSFNLFVKDEYNNPVNDKSVTFINPEGPHFHEGNQSSGNALDITRSLKSRTDSDGNLGLISVKSYAPGIMNGDFKAQLKQWDDEYSDIGNPREIKTLNALEEGYRFLPLYTAEMAAEENMLFGQKQELKFTFTEEEHDRKGVAQNLETDVLDGVQTEPDNAWKLTGVNEKGKGGKKQILPPNNEVIQTFIAEQVKKFTGATKILAKPRIFYTIDGKPVSYHLSDLEGNGAEVNKIYIGGQEQSQGKQDFVSDTAKVGNNSWVTARNAIARSVVELTRNRTPGESVVNGVKYITGDQTLSGEVQGEYKTLIVEGGNITFDKNFNTKKENIAIIVMKKGDETKGNIYIKPNVAFISALIFTEGSIESVNEEGKLFTISDKERTQALSKQIVFHGGLYSRNTIGGAVHGEDGQYVLPGAVKTSDFHKAVRFDLSFLRMRAGGNDDENHTKKYNQGRTESVIVWPNAEAISNPPPGFRLQ